MKQFAIIGLLMTTVCMFMYGPQHTGRRAVASPAPKVQAAKETPQAVSTAITPAPLVVEDAGATNTPIHAGPRAHQDEKPWSNPAGTSSAAFVAAYPSPRRTLANSCAAGFCQPAAATPRRYIASRPLQRVLRWRR